MLERLFGGAAVAAADDQHLLRRRVRAERGVDQILVVDELLLLGGHVEPVEAEDLAVVLGLVDLHLLELGLPLADLFSGPDVEAGRGVERAAARDAGTVRRLVGAEKELAGDGVGVENLARAMRDQQDGADDRGDNRRDDDREAEPAVR